jgi:hypothetical protein
MLRQSVLWIDELQAQHRQLAGLEIAETFKELIVLENEYVRAHATDELQVAGESAELEAIFRKLKDKATAIDATLDGAAGAVLTKCDTSWRYWKRRCCAPKRRKWMCSYSE